MSTFKFLKVFTAGALKGLSFVDEIQFTDWAHFAAWAKNVNAANKTTRSDNKGLFGNFYVLDPSGYDIQ